MTADKWRRSISRLTPKAVSFGRGIPNIRESRTPVVATQEQGSQMVTSFAILIIAILL